VIKRVFDFLFALGGLIILFPLFVVIAIWIKVDSRGPIFFKQKRVGRFNKEIEVYKFRSMVTDAESKGLKITVGRDPRITNSGHFIRKYKIDELAQLINVVNGSMSLVGPRPEVEEYMDTYPQNVREKVLSIRPGITDLASIKFKDENNLLQSAECPHETYINDILPIKQKYYLQYVEQQSLWLDIKLIFMTILAIVR
jgi:lipopolysaccharide/colanic/teichoic acid biosynthesis glycosyltransferase